MNSIFPLPIYTLRRIKTFERFQNISHSHFDMSKIFPIFGKNPENRTFENSWYFYERFS